MAITYLEGDATKPTVRPALIIHVCNDVGGWGRGFVTALSNWTPLPELAYRRLTGHQMRLGEVTFVTVEDDLFVANMIAQHGMYADNNDMPPIRYEALADCLVKVRDWTAYNDRSIHAPRIGCGLAGGKWIVVEALLNNILGDRRVYIYDLPEMAA